MTLEEKWPIDMAKALQDPIKNGYFHDEQLEAVKRCGALLTYIKNQTEELCWEALKNDPRTISLIKKPTEEMRLYAVGQDGDLLRYVNNPSKQVCLKAIEQEPNSIKYIENPTYDMCVRAISKWPRSMKLIKNQTTELQDFAFKRSHATFADFKNPSYDLCMKAVSWNPFMLKYVPEQTPELIKAGVSACKDDMDINTMLGVLNDEQKKYSFSLIVEKETGSKDIDTYMKEHPNYLDAFIDRFPSYFQFVENQSYEKSVDLIEMDPYSLQYIKNKTPDLCMLAAEKHGGTLAFIENQTPDICWAALKKDPYNALANIKNPTKEMCDFAFEQEPQTINLIPHPTSEMYEDAMRKGVYYLTNLQNLSPQQWEDFSRFLVKDVIWEMEHSDYNEYPDFEPPEWVLETLKHYGADTELAKRIITEEYNKIGLASGFESEIERNPTVQEKIEGATQGMPLALSKSPEEWIELFTKSGLDPKVAKDVVEKAYKNIEMKQDYEGPVIGDND